MVRIWAKIIKDDKIIRDTIFEKFETFNADNFFDYLSSICENLNIATPIILTKHIFHYLAFNLATFSNKDFPEEIDFDKLVIEEASNY